MKLNNLLTIITIVAVFFLSACMKEELNEPVSSNCNLPFTDSSAGNPKDQLYQSLLDRYVKEGLPGLVLLIRTPEEGLWIGSSGYAGIEDKTPMKKCNIFYSASIGKTYCAVAIMQLVDEGKIDLDDKINLYLSADICKNIPNGNTATIRNLLGHTSGIPNFDDATQFIADVLNNPFSITTNDLIEYIYGKSPLFAPGAGYEYSSTGYELLTRIIDQVTGENHSQYYTSHLFQPLGLNSTYYKNETGFPKPPGLVNCYFDRLGDGKIENVSDVNNYLTQIFTGSDGIMASAYDYSLFIEALMKGNLVSANSLEQMTTWHDTYSSKPAVKYGLGLYQIETKYGFKVGHDGDAMGAAADMYYFPGEDITIVTATTIGTFLDTDLSLKYNQDFQNELLEAVFN
ncbi:MAG TPA: serine hydrolase domain-containing protein [Chitinophagales bacterium]|nr:serine hydrolase domain-containing protein [Chitinophagales bacterium]